jgi:hypothetical protein
VRLSARAHRVRFDVRGYAIERHALRRLHDGLRCTRSVPARELRDRLRNADTVWPRLRGRVGQQPTLRALRRRVPDRRAVRRGRMHLPHGPTALRRCVRQPELRSRELRTMRYGLRPRANVHGG